MSDMDTKYIGKFRIFLFKNRFAKTEQHPAWQGRVSFTPEQIRRLSKRAEGLAEDAEILCEAAGWVRKDKNKDDYLFVSADADTAPRQSGGGVGTQGSDDDVPF